MKPTVSKCADSHCELKSCLKKSFLPEYTALYSLPCNLPVPLNLPCIFHITTPSMYIPGGFYLHAYTIATVATCEQ